MTSLHLSIHEESDRIKIHATPSAQEPVHDREELHFADVAAYLWQRIEKLKSKTQKPFELSSDMPEFWSLAEATLKEIQKN